MFPNLDEILSNDRFNTCDCEFMAINIFAFHIKCMKTLLDSNNSNLEIIEWLF